MINEVRHTHPKVDAIHIAIILALLLLLYHFLGNGGMATVPPGWLGWLSTQRMEPYSMTGHITWNEPNQAT